MGLVSDKMKGPRKKESLPGDRDCDRAVLLFDVTVAAGVCSGLNL